MIWPASAARGSASPMTIVACLTSFIANLGSTAPCPGKKTGQRSGNIAPPWLMPSSGRKRRSATSLATRGNLQSGKSRGAPRLRLTAWSTLRRARWIRISYQRCPYPESWAPGVQIAQQIPFGNGCPSVAGPTTVGGVTVKRPRHQLVLVPAASCSGAAQAPDSQHELVAVMRDTPFSAIDLPPRSGARVPPTTISCSWGFCRAVQGTAVAGGHRRTALGHWSCH